jgi:hypothetical protein
VDLLSQDRDVDRHGSPFPDWTQEYTPIGRIGVKSNPPLLGGLATVATYETAFAAGSVLALTATVLVGGALVGTRSVSGSRAVSSD